LALKFLYMKVRKMTYFGQNRQFWHLNRQFVRAKSHFRQKRHFGPKPLTNLLFDVKNVQKWSNLTLRGSRKSCQNHQKWRFWPKIVISPTPPPPYLKTERGCGFSGVRGTPRGKSRFLAENVKIDVFDPRGSILIKIVKTDSKQGWIGTDMRSKKWKNPDPVVHILQKVSKSTFLGGTPKWSLFGPFLDPFLDPKSLDFQY